MMILLGNSVADSLRQGLEAHFDPSDFVSASISRFPSTEAFCEIRSEIAGQDIVLVQSMGRSQDHSANDFAFETLLTIKTLKRYGAASIKLIAPFIAFARQDRAREGKQDSIGTQDFADMLRLVGCDGITTFDIHSEASRAYYQNIFGAHAHFPQAAILYQDYFKTLVLNQPLVGGPDLGADHRAAELATALQAEQFHTNKERQASRTVLLECDAHPKDRDIILIDDMIDTGGTILNAAKWLKANEATRVFAVATHGIFSHNALDSLLRAKTIDNQALFDQLIITDSIDSAAQLQLLERQYGGVKHRLKVLSLAPLVAEQIEKL